MNNLILNQKRLDALFSVYFTMFTMYLFSSFKNTHLFKIKGEYDPHQSMCLPKGRPQKKHIQSFSGRDKNLRTLSSLKRIKKKYFGSSLRPPLIK